MAAERCLRQSKAPDKTEKQATEGQRVNSGCYVNYEPGSDSVVAKGESKLATPGRLSTCFAATVTIAIPCAPPGLLSDRRVCLQRCRDES